MGNKIQLARKEDIKAKYSIREKLGTGSFATVKRAIHKQTGVQYAIKIIEKKKLDPQELNILNEEVEIMFKFEHPNCVKLHEIFDTNKKLYMVMELLTGGELFDRIITKGSFTENEASTLVRKLSNALSYLHSIGIVHRDLKPENLIYATADPDAEIKITDFGLAKFLVDEAGSMTTACGTPGYVAPEILSNKAYGKQVDMWSLGVILYILLCGFPPFYDESTPQLYAAIKKGAYNFPSPYWDNISSDAKDLVRKLLTVDPASRYTVEQVLSHPWVQVEQSQTPIDVVSNLREYNARLRLRKGVNTVIAMARMSKATKSLQRSEDEPSDQPPSLDSHFESESKSNQADLYD